MYKVQVHRINITNNFNIGEKLISVNYAVNQIFPLKNVVTIMFTIPIMMLLAALTDSGADVFIVPCTSHEVFLTIACMIPK